LYINHYKSLHYPPLINFTHTYLLPTHLYTLSLHVALPISPVRRISSSTSSSLRARNFFCGWVYMSQKVHWFHEQPLVTGKINDRPSLGGRNTGSIYSMGNSMQPP